MNNEISDIVNNDLIPPEIKNDDFYRAIQKISREENIKTVLEIGSSSGEGSTEALVTGLRHNPKQPTLFCMEVLINRFNELKKRYENESFVKCYNISSVSVESFPDEKDVIYFYNNIQSNLNFYSLDVVLSWLRKDIEYLKTSGVYENGIEQIKQENNIDFFDLVLIDGSEFTGIAELEAIYGAKIICLDDIRTFKNYANHQKLLKDTNYILIEQNTFLRNGYSIFRKIENSELPIHFFTIVLNGQPFIRYHIDVLKNLPFKWHWHIVEGVADLKHDTSWSLQLGGRVSDDIHKNGRSCDGTTEYIEELAQLHPDNITIYRKPEGIFWDGKREMVNVPLANIQEECLLWQVDVDELWTFEQICTARKMFIKSPNKTAAFYWCWYFVGEKLIISTRNCYAQNPQQEWLRTWKFKPGAFWVAHEPPVLVEPLANSQLQNVAAVNPFLHQETENFGLIFQHFAYVTPEQLQFKEQYYGYRNAVSQWKRLQLVRKFPAMLREYFAWVRDETKVDTAESYGVVVIAQRDVGSNNWQFLPPDELKIQKAEIKKTATINTQNIKNAMNNIKNKNNHILLYTDDPGSGGVAQYNHSLMCGLVKLGYRVTCVQSYTTNPLITQRQELGIEHLWLEVDTSKPDISGRTLTDSTDAKRIFIDAQPDLIIFSDCCPISNFTAKQVAITLDIPYIIVIGFVAYYLTSLFHKELFIIQCRIYQKSNDVIAVSSENLELLHQYFGLPKNKGQVIYYGRPIEYFNRASSSVRDRLRQELGIPKDSVVCFTSARLEPVKGYQYQIAAIELLKQSEIWSQVYFVWAGNIRKDFAEHILNKIESLGVSNQVKILGQRWDISDLLDNADIFILPSELEGMPLAIMEAMAKGLPVIASAVSGIPEEMGETGKLLTDPKIAPEATVRELAQTIENWSKNPQIRQSVGQACKQRAKELFTEERMIQNTAKVIHRALLPNGDYVSPGLEIIQPDYAFPNMIIGNTSNCAWPYLRCDIPHNWYVDKRQQAVGFLSRDEAHIIYNTALKFPGKKALEIGCWMGWSACHLALAGLELDVIDPLLNRTDIYESVSSSLQSAGVIDSVNLVGGYSPQKVEELATKLESKWSLIFIDGNHDAPGPLDDAITCETFAEEDAIVMFHDLTSPDVAQGLDYFKDKGWNTMVYQTMQIMGVAWRGNVEPVKHIPDPNVYWSLPEHLQGYNVSGLLQDKSKEEFQVILNFIKPYTLLSEERLFSLYSLTKEICLKDIPGNLVECGSYKGGAAALLATVVKRYSLRPRLIYACDTFEGMPEPIKLDKHNGIDANSTGFGVDTLKAPITENLDVICNILEAKDIVVPIQGLFSQTLPKYKSDIGSIALLHADGDGYESTLDIFNSLYDIIVPDGFIQVDDYGHWEGCKKAIHEFEKLRREKFLLNNIDYTGVWFKKLRCVQKLKPQVLLDGVFFQLYQTGIARVWKSLLEEWANNKFSKHILVLDRANTAPKINGINYLTIPLYDYNNTEADQLMLQQICEEEEAELFISSYYTTPINIPSVFMAYDMIPEVLGGNLNELMWQEKHNGIKHASAFIAISENTAKDLSRFFPDIPLESITVAHCGVDSLFSPASEGEIKAFKYKYGINKPYFLLVGSSTGYKNGILFFQALSKLASGYGFDVICTGIGGVLVPELRVYTSGSAVHLVQLSDEELALAYSGAVALVYPSKYEGFGMPVLEAMACGCPVITCPNASIPEVTGEAAIYVNDNDVEALANALCEVQKPSVRQSLITAGLAQAKNFSWKKMAQTVSSALINATLLSLNLKETNLIIFPDWFLPEDELTLELAEVIKVLASHPESSNTTLLISINSIDAEEAAMFLSSVSMNLLLEEDLDISEGLEVAPVGNLAASQWEALLPRIHAKIILPNEDKRALAEVPVGSLKSYELYSWINQLSTSS